MILKIIGSLFVIISSSIIGFYYAAKDGFRINDLREMKKALVTLQSEIEFTQTPLPEAMENISKRVNEPIKFFFETMKIKLEEKSGDGLHKIWETCINDSLKNSYLFKEDLSCLIGLGKTLGYLDKNLQINSIQIVINYFDEEVKSLENNKNENRKMYQSLGVLGGMLVVIILI